MKLIALDAVVLSEKTLLRCRSCGLNDVTPVRAQTTPGMVRRAFKNPFYTEK